MPNIYFVGVDVGTSSARAALVNSKGEVLKQHSKPIQIWNPQPDHYEQSSDDIWDAVCECVQKVVADVPKNEVVSISFDATCSLVVLDSNGKPLSVSTTGKREQNIILWMDHRASKETELINSKKHNILQYVGGQVSLEMEIPKLLWLKNNLNLSTWSRMGLAFDLPDFLTWKSTGCEARSFCSVVCKWNYDGENECWSEDYLNEIGLKELCSESFKILGSKINEPGVAVGDGLTKEAAKCLNLNPGTFVGSSLIDAHAGALASLGCVFGSGHIDIERRLALVCGTSTCHMSLTKKPCRVQGIWGPYKNAVLPNFYLNEGGQSAAGVLIDFFISNHPTTPDIRKKLSADDNIYSYLYKILEKLATEKSLSNISYLTPDIHVWPDFHGNRSPIADPTLKGMISGLNMKSDEDELAVSYLAIVQSLAYGTRHIIDKLHEEGRPQFESLVFSGGLSKNSLYVTTHADVTNLQCLVPHEDEMVLVGAAISGACAAKIFPTLQDASHEMGGTGILYTPNQETIDFHNRKYKVFLKMLQDQRSYKEIMECAL